MIPTCAIPTLLYLVSAAVFAGSCSESNSDRKTASQLDSMYMAGDYAYPEAEHRLVQPDEVSRLSDFALKIMKNEILARHGYVFKTHDMQDYFDRQSWYKPDNAF